MSASDVLLLDKPMDVPVAAGHSLELAVSVSHSLAAIEPVWRALAAGRIESPGQSFDFTRLWIEALGIPEADQFYLTAHLGGAPLALVPLHRSWRKGIRVLGWFPGAHVGCNAPLVDSARLAAMPAAARRALWIKLLRSVPGADLVSLRSVPQLVVDGIDLFAELGQPAEGDTLYRASFVSFEEADRTQRNKSRRKHDRQQGDKLAAMGPVEFDAIDNGPEAERLLETLFRQRAARFAEMGVADPFAFPAIRRFYDATARAGSGVPVKLHALKLKGDVVALRYNIAHGDRLFCLISSMSEDAKLRPGSPGKQCLLRVMQTVFAEGYRIFDMGEGETDEKRHWCNVEIPVRHHFMPITRRGALAASAWRGWHALRRRIKSDPRLLALAKGVRGAMLKLAGRASASESSPEAE